MPVVPSSLLEPAWVEFCAVIGGDRREFHPAHPLGCHRRRVPGRVVFEHVVAALVHGSGYERIATPGCSDRTIRRRLAEWAQLGAAEALHDGQQPNEPPFRKPHPKVVIHRHQRSALLVNGRPAEAKK